MGTHRKIETDSESGLAALGWVHFVDGGVEQKGKWTHGHRVMIAGGGGIRGINGNEKI